MAKEKIDTIEKIAISQELKSAVFTDLDESRRVLVRCHVSPQKEEVFIRIWTSTFLMDENSDHVSSLQHAENISYFPNWTKVEKGKRRQFVLIFDALPKRCKKFHFIEQIPQGGGFICMNIPRNEEDIYDLEMI